MKTVLLLLESNTEPRSTSCPVNESRAMNPMFWLTGSVILKENSSVPIPKNPGSQNTSAKIKNPIPWPAGNTITA
ncbi:MAG TPA: hypothetical protein PK678_17305, partial [Ferruginibacter sp.]|nr:hypothetical protein [Ferruginibacter sp.]